MNQVFINGSDDVLPGSATEYNYLTSAGRIPITEGDATWVATETIVQAVVPGAGTLKNLYVNLTASPGAGKSRAFAVMVNGAASALTTTISDSATSNSDTTNSVTLAAGDTVSLRIIPTGTPASAKAKWSAEFVGDTNAQFFHGSGTDNSPLINATEYNAVHAAWAWTTTEADFLTLIPSSCTITALYWKLGTAPGSGQNRRLSIRVNGVENTTTRTTISDTATTGNVTGLSVSLVAGDYITLQCTSSVNPAATSYITWGVLFTAGTDGESFVCGVTSDSPSVLSDEVIVLSGTAKNYALTGSEDNVKQTTGVTSHTFKNFRVLLQTAPGTGNSVSYQLRIDGVDGNSIVTVSGTATSGTDGVNTDALSQGQLLNLYHVPTSSPSVGKAAWAAITYIVPPVTMPFLLPEIPVPSYQVIGY